MRKQLFRTTPRAGTRKCMALVAPAVMTALVLYVSPGPVSADVELKRQNLTAQQARLTHGEDLYNELCAVCHGQTGKGDGPAVPALNQVPIDLTVLAAGNNDVFPRAALHESIYGRNRISAHGTVDMPIWGRAFEFTKPDWGRVKRIKFAKHRVDNIVDYIESLQAE